MTERATEERGYTTESEFDRPERRVFGSCHVLHLWMQIAV